ncbi:MAG: hypothetical protein M0Q45_06700 [Bacteroidales bacterium]|jgi:hypothetical protein|nr:hypothetical protein [Bacteroidales bacterium]MCK9499177.1 hypothetical protein [Bacteroidales bacterium]MDY0314446.1 hypothetical protein [Bacteroidales bacterium]
MENIVLNISNISKTIIKFKSKIDFFNITGFAFKLGLAYKLGKRIDFT